MRPFQFRVYIGWGVVPEGLTLGHRVEVERAYYREGKAGWEVYIIQ